MSQKGLKKIGPRDPVFRGKKTRMPAVYRNMYRNLSEEQEEFHIDTNQYRPITRLRTFL
jgi:hypothetical protein